MKLLLSIAVLLLVCTTLLAQTEWNKKIVIDPETPTGTPRMGILNLAGICAVLGKDKETNKILIQQVLPEGAAEKAGLLAKDEIVTIDKNMVKGMELEEIVSFLRGDPGTKVTVTVIREGFTSPKDFIVTREQVRLKEVPSVSFAIGAETSARQIAIEIIQQEFQEPDYTPRNESDQEAIIASAINSRKTLSQLMMQDALSDELRICFAIHLITIQLERIEATSISSPSQQKIMDIHTRELMDKRDLLAKSLIK